jgi:hypothetical protein
MGTLNSGYIPKRAAAVLLKDFIARNLFCKGRILYGLMVIAAVIIYYRQSAKLFLPCYVDDYLNDLLCMPLVLGLLLSTIRYLKNDSSFQFSKSFIAGLALYYSVYFEYYLPGVNARYTADPIDVLLYFLGVFLFYACHKTCTDRPG